jgi:superfamily I DNA/RNA helicase
LTLGVLYRVEELADRPHGNKPEKHYPYHSIIPMVDLLSEIFRVGPKSKKVNQAYFSALEKLGSELNILHYLEPEEIDAAGIPLLGEAVGRMRQKKIYVNPGYDGEYGKVKIFTDYERQKILGQQSLFAVPAGVASEEKKAYQKPAISRKTAAPSPADQQKAAQPNLPKTGETGSILGQLNNNQRRAVEHPCGPLMIVAGPGTGKTRTLTHRIAYLIRQRNIAPQNILAVTFTNKAAEEMRVRLQDLFGDDRQMPFVATFHGLCLNVLNELNPLNHIIIADDDDRKKLISEAIKIVTKKGSSVAQKPQAVLKQIVDAKQRIMHPDDVLNASVDHFQSETQLFFIIYRTYQDLLAIQGLNDYEDLIFNVVRRFESDPKVCRVYQDRFKHIFVDEYQDLNQGQYRIIRALAPAQHSTQDICVIGDPDQSIYGFRGSDTKYFTRFVHDYPQAGVIRLTRNYRSTEAILGASFQVISAHHEQPPNSRTYSQIDGIQTISILELAHEKAEAQTIARTIENLVGGTGFHSIDTGKIDDANISGASSYSDFAVLYRTHAQHRIIADVFDNAGIPFQIASRENALSQPGLPELISYLKIVEGCAAYGDHERVMHAIMPGIWKKSRDAFKNWCYQNRFSLQQGLSNAKRFPVPGLSTANQQTLNYFSNHFEELAKILAELKVAEKLIYLVKNTKLSTTFERDARSVDALENLVETAERFDYRPADFFGAMALHTDTDMYASRAEKVSLMTMHAAKGLEFPIVFISGCEQGYIPFERSNSEPQDIEEERRLFYVAMTRAMTRLYFTRAKSRRIYGRLESRSPSPFVTDIEAHLKKDESPRITRKKKKSDQKQLSLF